MSLFTSTSCKEFSERIKAFDGLIQQEKLSIDEIIKKKQYVQICSLKLDESNHSYQELAELLNVSISGFQNIID
jgi:hypothetical protein